MIRELAWYIESGRFTGIVEELEEKATSYAASLAAGSEDAGERGEEFRKHNESRIDDEIEDVHIPPTCTCKKRHDKLTFDSYGSTILSEAQPLRLAILETACIKNAA